MTDPATATSPLPREAIEWTMQRLDLDHPLEVVPLTGGRSNPLYRLVFPDRAIVIRIQPPGVLLGGGAHRLDREFRVQSALNSIAFPVPEMLALCTDTSVSGRSFYAMGHVDGLAITSVADASLSPGQRTSIADTMVETMARLHALEPEALGLSDFAAPGDYVERQLSRWVKQYEADEDAGRVSDLERLAEWLDAHRPRVVAKLRLVHGDYRIDNVLLSRATHAVAAVVDWELATLGNPLADLAYHCTLYHLPPAILGGIGGLGPPPGWPAEMDYVARYCAASGLDHFPDYGFHLAFAFFRLASIFHGIRGRVVRSSAEGASAIALARHVETVAAIGWKKVLGTTA